MSSFGISISNFAWAARILKALSLSCSSLTIEGLERRSLLEDFDLDLSELLDFGELLERELNLDDNLDVLGLKLPEIDLLEDEDLLLEGLEFLLLDEDFCWGFLEAGPLMTPGFSPVCFGEEGRELDDLYEDFEEESFLVLLMVILMPSELDLTMYSEFLTPFLLSPLLFWELLLLLGLSESFLSGRSGEVCADFNLSITAEREPFRFRTCWHLAAVEHVVWLSND